MNILISPNSFKNSLSAAEAAAAIEEGLMKSKLKGNFVCFPIADGGDGTGTLLTKWFNGIVCRLSAHDPSGRSITASYGIVDEGKTAIIEMAAASGLHLLNPGKLDPLRATSAGTGELIMDALNRGVEKIIIAMGGSATVDGGMGILQALGARFFDKTGNLLSTPANLLTLSAIDISGMDKRLTGKELIVLCDVENKLLGPLGAAAVFGPQKGASPADVKVLEQALMKLSAVICDQFHKNIDEVSFGGTAGGAAAGLYGLLDARLVKGIDHFLELTRFDIELSKSDLLITGEGSIDLQTLAGKGPSGVARLAKLRGIPVVGLAGEVPENPGPEMSKHFDALFAIGHKPLSTGDALTFTRTNLTRISRDLGNLLAFGNGFN